MQQERLYDKTPPAGADSQVGKGYGVGSNNSVQAQRGRELSKADIFFHIIDSLVGLYKVR